MDWQLIYECRLCMCGLRSTWHGRELTHGQAFTTVAKKPRWVCATHFSPEWIGVHVRRRRERSLALLVFYLAGWLVHCSTCEFEHHGVTIYVSSH